MVSRTNTVRELSCNICGQVRWGIDNAVCSMTLGCTGRLQRKGDKEHDPKPRTNVDGSIGQTSWTQSQLYEAAG